MIKKVFEDKISVSVTVIIGIIVYRLGVYYALQPKFNASLVHGIFTNIILTLNHSPFLSVLVSTLTVIIQGLILTRLVGYYNILDKPGSSVLLSLGILYSLFPESLFINHIYFASTLFMLGMYSVFQFLEKKYKKAVLLQASFLFGFSALSLSEFYWSFVLLISAVIIFKTVKLSDILIIFFGMAIPFYIIASFGYLFSWDWSISNNWRSWLLVDRSSGLNWTNSYKDFIVICLLIITALIGLSRQIGAYFRYNVETRRSLLAMMVLALFLLIVCAARWYIYKEYFILLAIPLAIYHSVFFKRENTNWWISTIWFVYFLVAISPIWWNIILTNK